MGINAENFSLSINYDKEEDKLDIECDRELNNGDILLLLVNILTMIEEQYRPAILEIAEVAIKDNQLQQKEIN